MIRNRNLHFICDRIFLKVERTDLSWTKNDHSQPVVNFPIAHGEGCYYADSETLKKLENNGCILFRYASSSGDTSLEHNPNGSLHNIAGIVNEQGNILGMMPHPERASDPILGATDGIHLFKGLL